LASSSPVTGKGSVNTIDLDSLMTEQHATWYVPGNKALIEDPSNDKCLGYWDRARGQSDNKEDPGPALMKAIPVRCAPAEEEEEEEEGDRTAPGL
ncbi:hypothetical protein cypCar_00043120, partial [Cyprinus carpio]